MHLPMLLFEYNLNAQNPCFTRETAIEYITDYYYGFITGYDFDGNFITLSTNYNATFSGSVFTLTFDSLDKNKNMQPQKITYDLKNVKSMTPSVIEIVEIYQVEILIAPLSKKIASHTPDGFVDMADSEFYAAFSHLISEGK